MRLRVSCAFQQGLCLEYVLSLKGVVVSVKTNHR
jgi:hypothetical protein